jgi:hypothetical protein
MALRTSLLVNNRTLKMSSESKVQVFSAGMGMRMLPHKDMLGLRSYFLFSTLTLATTMLTIDCPLYLLDAVVMGHHIFCYLTWNQSPQSKKVSSFPE